MPSAQPKMRQVTGEPDAGQRPPTSGGGGNAPQTVGPPKPTTPPGGPGGSGQFGSQYQGAPAFTGGPQNLPKAGQSFSDTTRLQGALPFWQSPGVQVAGTHGYEPGQTFAGQRVTGESISGNPMVQAAMNDYQMNVMPGIQDQFNLMGLGRSSASGNAQAKAQAGMLLPIYQQLAGLENEGINRETMAGEQTAGRGQQEIDRLYGGTESELGRRERSATAQTQGQQQMFENMMAMDQMTNAQRQSGAGQLFDMGGQARDYAQQGNTSQYQDFLRRQGLSEEALNPFGGIQGLTGTVTNGK